MYNSVDADCFSLNPKHFKWPKPFHLYGPKQSPDPELRYLDRKWTFRQAFVLFRHTPGMIRFLKAYKKLPHRKKMKMAHIWHHCSIKHYIPLERFFFIMLVDRWRINLKRNIYKYKKVYRGRKVIGFGGTDYQLVLSEDILIDSSLPADEFIEIIGVLFDDLAQDLEYWNTLP